MTTIKSLQRALTDKKISCAELTRLYLGAAARTSPELCAYIALTEDAAMHSARRIDDKLASGAELSGLDGIPYILKDNIVTSGIKTTCASRMLEDYIPCYDAAVYEYLRDGGAIMLGKGNMDELAIGTTGETSVYGTAKNPHDVSRIAGGSSGGVTAAVAAGVAAFGIGSDTGGSVRLPAAYCGVYGLKPTYGAVSRYGLVAVASSFDQVSPAAICADDIAAVFALICRRDARDMTSIDAGFASGSDTRDVSGLKIGIPKECFDGLAPDISAAVMDAARTLERLGAELVPVSIPILDLCLPAYFILSGAEVSSNLGRFDGLRFGHRAEQYSSIDDFISRSRAEGFGSVVRRRILFGTAMLSAGYFDDYYLKATEIKNAVRNEMRSLLGTCDCLLTPTAPTVSPTYGAKQDNPLVADKYTAPVSLAGLPALSVPCGRDAGGLPVGMQLIAGDMGEDLLIGIARAFENETAQAFIAQTDMGVKL